MIKNKIIVIGGDHHNTLGVVRSLGEAGISSYLLIVSPLHSSFVSKSNYVNKTWIVDTTLKMLQVLRTEFLSETLPPVIFSTSDSVAEELDQNYNWLRKRFILPNIDDKEKQISYWMNKSTMLHAAEMSGFSIPETYHFDLNETISVDSFDNIKFPCIVKPEKSSEGSKNDFCICSDKHLLLEYYEKVRHSVSKVLIQEYLKPDYEISFLGTVLPNRKINIIPGVIYKISTCRSIYNLGMMTNACLKPIAYLDSFIARSCVDRLFSVIPYTGLYSIEFMICKGKPYFLEINFRTDGNTFLYTAAGVNLPLLWLSDVTKHEISSLNIEVKKDTYGMTEISYIKYFQWFKIFQGIKDLWHADCFSIFSKKDLKPFIYKFIYFFKN